MLALLSLLMFLGFVLFTFSDQERASAQSFALAAKTPATDPNYFDWALEQIIVGPDDSLRNSALHGRRHSILTNMLGMMLIPIPAKASI